MAILRHYLVLLLWMLALGQCIPCEASTKMLMEIDPKGHRGILSMSRKILAEEGEEANDMETELILPDETESETLVIEQKNPSEKSEKRDKQDESMLPELGHGDLPLEGSQNEKSAGEKPQKNEKRTKSDYGAGEKGKVDGSTEEESMKQLTGEYLQEEATGEKKKEINDMEELLLTGQTIEETPSWEMGERDKVEDHSGEASQLDIETKTETGGDTLLSEVGKEDGSNLKEKVQTEKQSIDDTNQYKEDDAKETSLKPKESKKEKVDEAIKAKTNKADIDEVLKSEIEDDKTAKKKAVQEEVTDEAMPADIIDREMQGEVEDLVTKEVNENKIIEEKQQTDEEAGSTLTKQQRSLDKPKQTKGAEAKKKKAKTHKQSKSEGQVLIKEDAESKGPKYIDGNDMETKPKQKKEKSADPKSPAELEGDSVLKPGETSESQSKQVETQDEPKTKSKKKKVKVFESSQKEEKYSERNYEEEMLSNEAEVTRQTQQSQVKKPSKGTEDELPTIEKQEEKFESEAQSIAKEAQERAEESVSSTESLSASAQGVDEDDDEYGDFLQDFTDFSTKFQDTAIKVADHLGPNIQKITDTSKVYFNKANQQITESFSPLVGKQIAPFFASLLSYSLLLIPLGVVVLLFEHIRALLSLQKVLLFVNIYLAAYFATLLLATFVMGEPMNYFYKSSASGYVHLQLLQALAYIVYLILQTFDLVFTCTSETIPVRVTVALQWLVAFTVGFHYYVTVFHRAMTLKGPHTNWKIYGIYSIAFLVLCLFARIKRVKKGYLQLGQADADKKH